LIKSHIAPGGEQPDVRVRKRFVGVDDGLSVVREHLDEVLIDKDSQRQIFSIG